ncbi:hypothetical protein [Massilia putida]|uniref:hypothetical protein n=1 Tax=Massilia putida TaxID=1141883 RepID=UPI0012EC8952|nr:hypothetical protein [Massilia putida]
MKTMSVCNATTLMLALSLCEVSSADETPKAPDKMPQVITAAPSSSLISSAGAQITASNDGSSASIKIGKETSTLTDETAQFSTWNLSAEAPIGKTDSPHRLFSVDGFENATAIGVSYMRFQTGVSPGNLSKLTEYCNKMRSAAEKSVSLPPGTDAKKLECTATNFAKYLSSDLYQEARASMPGPTPGGVLWGAALKYGRQNSTFYDATTLSKNEVHNNPWSASLYAGWNPSSVALPQFYVLKVTRKQDYKDLDQSVRCPALATSTTIACVTGSIGMPKSQASTLFGLEGRILIGSSVGISPSVTRDKNVHKTTIDFPVYLLANKDSALSGGFGVSWDSQDKKTTLGLFVGAPFNVWPF